jgi:aryl-alcohol dehydrogenase-like predicted oxidoreductase
LTSAAGVSLILGTAQFGLAYGVAGRGEPVPENEVRQILELADESSVHSLDTAPGYGDIESRLAVLCSGLSLRVTSKIPPVPEAGAEKAVRNSVEQSRERLGNRLTTLLFHRAEDLLRPDADTIWRAATDAGGSLRLGVSCYDPEAAVKVRVRFGIPVTQMPVNPLDQRLRDRGIAEALSGVEIHARSVFLQGLLLMSGAAARARVPAAAAAHKRWVDWCRDHRIAPVAAALAVTRGLPGVRYCVVGVDSSDQLRGVLDSTSTTEPTGAVTLRCDDPNVIDPRRWNAA